MFPVLSLDYKTIAKIFLDPKLGCNANFRREKKDLLSIQKPISKQISSKIGRTKSAITTTTPLKYLLKNHHRKTAKYKSSS